MKNILISFLLMLFACGPAIEITVEDVTEYKEIVKAKTIVEKCYNHKLEDRFRIMGSRNIEDVHSACGSNKAYGCIDYLNFLIIYISENKHSNCVIAAHEYSHQAQFETGKPISEPYRSGDPYDKCIDTTYLQIECGSSE